MRGLFITGTDTEVGKTYVAAWIARCLVAQGRRVGVYKPVASGCSVAGGELIADDAVTLWDAAGRPGRLQDVCPQRFAAALAPPVAARLEGKSVDADLLRRGIEVWRQSCEFVLIEGAGGLMSPLSATDFNADLCRAFGHPMIVVARNTLGTINATLQTVITAGALCPQVPLAGVILNTCARDASDVSLAHNGDELRKHCQAPLLAEVPYAALPEQEIDWWNLAGPA